MPGNTGKMTAKEVEEKGEKQTEKIEIVLKIKANTICIHSSKTF